MKLLEELRQAIVDGMPDHAAELARQAVEQGMEPAQALDEACVPGMCFAASSTCHRRSSIFGQRLRFTDAGRG
jgi:methanogenic corrinoid protein MtbC1